MNIIIFEDKFFTNLYPFAYNHASFEIKTGLLSNLDRFKKAFDNANLIFVVRQEIESLVKERFPDLNINPSVIPSGYCLNSRILWREDYNQLYLNDYNYTNTQSLLIYNNLSDTSIKDFHKKIFGNNSGEINNSILVINYLWDAIDLFSDTLNRDLNNSKLDHIIKQYDSVFSINQSNIYIGDGTTIRPGSVLDAQSGPIVIGKNVVVDIGSKIQGPVFIDDESYISPGALIRANCLIGENCKIGGEVSNSIFHAFSNKAHDGFIGHSYIGEWVNIGAGTNNSNLKNNYSNIKFNFKNHIVDTQRLFLGSMIGDYTKIGISSMLNTGTYIGFGANIFGSGFTKKFNESFSWGKNDRVDLNRFLQTCSIVKERRGKKISSIEEKFIKDLYSEK